MGFFWGEFSAPVVRLRSSIVLLFLSFFFSPSPPNASSPVALYSQSSLLPPFIPKNGWFYWYSTKFPRHSPHSFVQHFRTKFLSRLPFYRITLEHTIFIYSDFFVNFLLIDHQLFNLCFFPQYLSGEFHNSWNLSWLQSSWSSPGIFSYRKIKYMKAHFLGNYKTQIAKSHRSYVHHMTLRTILQNLKFPFSHIFLSSQQQFLNTSWKGLSDFSSLDLRSDSASWFLSGATTWRWKYFFVVHFLGYSTY